MPVAQTQFLTAPFAIPPPAESWVLSFPSVWIWEGPFGRITGEAPYQSLSELKVILSKPLK